MRYVNVVSEFNVSGEPGRVYLTTRAKDSITRKGITVYNHTHREIFLAYRDGYVVNMEIHTGTGANDAAGRLDRNYLKRGIHIEETLTVSGRQLFHLNDQRQLNEETRNCLIGYSGTKGGLVQTILGFSNLPVVGQHQCLNDTYEIVRKWFIPQEVIDSLPVMFYLRQFDIAICSDPKREYRERFFHPYSENGTLMHMGERIVDNAEFSSIEDAFVLGLEIVDNRQEIGPRWIRPFTNDDVYRIDPVRDEGRESGFYFFRKYQANIDVISNSKRMSSERVRLSEEDFTKNYPHLRLFKNYSDAKQFDDQSEVRKLKQQLKELSQKQELGDLEHTRSIEKLNSDLAAINAKSELSKLEHQNKIEELNRKEQEHISQQRRSDEVHQQKLRQVEDDNRRLIAANEELHRQKQELRQREHEQEQRIAMHKAQFEHRQTKKKTFWEWVKSIPTLLGSVVKGAFAILTFAL